MDLGGKDRTAGRDAAWADERLARVLHGSRETPRCFAAPYSDTSSELCRNMSTPLSQQKREGRYGRMIKLRVRPHCEREPG